MSVIFFTKKPPTRKQRLAVDTALQDAGVQTEIIHDGIRGTVGLNLGIDPKMPCKCFIQGSNDYESNLPKGWEIEVQAIVDKIFLRR